MFYFCPSDIYAAIISVGWMLFLGVFSAFLHPGMDGEMDMTVRSGGNYTPASFSSAQGIKMGGLISGAHYNFFSMYFLNSFS